MAYFTYFLLSGYNQQIADALYNRQAKYHVSSKSKAEGNRVYACHTNKVNQVEKYDLLKGYNIPHITLVLGNN